MGISQKDFNQIQRRLSGKDAGEVALTGSFNSNTHRVILGVDPSVRGTGFGVIELGAHIPATTTRGIIQCPGSWPVSRCLLKIIETLRDVIKKHAPTVCVVEGLFYAQNVKTALAMGQARGAALAAAAEAGLEIFEIAPRKVKQAIVGYGAAQKQAVAKMVQTRLALEETPPPDEADALALALTFAQTGSSVGSTTIKPV